MAASTFFALATGHASGFRINEQGASAAGQANAFTAQADDPSAIHYNPAGMVQLRGLQMYGGPVLVGGGTTFTSPSGATATGHFGNRVAIPPPFNLYVTGRLDDLGLSQLRGITLGIGLTTPFGLQYHYPTTSPLATAVTREQLPLIDIKPTLAYQVTSYLALGVGADIYTFSGLTGSADGFSRQFLSSGGPGLPPAGTSVELTGRDTAVGYNVSALYTPFRNADGLPVLNLGVVYRSQASLQLSGNVLANGGLLSDVSTTMALPQIVTAGMALWPIRDRQAEWKVEVDVDYTDWSSFRNTDLRLSNGATIPFPQEYRGSYAAMVGTEWRWLQVPVLPGWQVALRAGYGYSQTPVPSFAFNPAAPDANRHVMSLGSGLLCRGEGRWLGVVPCSRRGVGLDVAYQAFLFESRTIRGNLNPVAIPGSVDGRYETLLHAVSINVRINL